MPVCRTDDFWEAQWSKVEQIQKLQREHGCMVLNAGDLFHHWKPSPRLLSESLLWLPEDFYTVYGQHDLPNHNLELKYKSGIYTLLMAERLEILEGASWGQEPGLNIKIAGRKILVWHKFVWDGKKVPWPGCDEMTAEQVLTEYPEYDLIVTGDYHKPFTCEMDGRLLVNPGCLTRQAADYADHRPRVYLWSAETNTVEPAYLKIEKDVVSQEHIERQQRRDKRIEAFVSRLSDDWKVDVSFEENLRQFFSENRVRKSVMELTYKAIES